MSDLLECAALYAKAQRAMTTCTMKTVNLQDNNEQRCKCYVKFNSTMATYQEENGLMCESSVVVDQNLTDTCSSYHEKWRHEEFTQWASETVTTFWDKHGSLIVTVCAAVLGAVVLFCLLRALCRCLVRSGALETCGVKLRSFGDGTAGVCQNLSTTLSQEVSDFTTWCADACSGSYDEKPAAGARPGRGGVRDAQAAAVAAEMERQPLKSQEVQTLVREEADFYRRGREPAGTWAGLNSFGHPAQEDLRHKEDEVGGPAYWAPPYYNAQINTGSGHHAVMSHPGAVGRPPIPVPPQQQWQAQPSSPPPRIPFPGGLI